MRRSSPANVFQGAMIALRAVADVACSVATFIIAYQLRFAEISKGTEIPPQENYIALAILFTVLSIYFMAVSGMYRPMRGASRIDIVFGAIRASSISLVILLALSFFYRDFSYSRLTIGYAAIIGYILLSSGRIVVVSFERALLRRGKGQKRVLLIGTGRNFERIAEKFTGRADLGYKLVGYVEEEKSGALGNAPLLGSLDEMEEIIVTHGIDMVVVSLESGYHDRMKDIVDLCDKRAIECLIDPDMVELLVGPRFFEEVCGSPLIRVKGLRIRGFNALVKRSMDIAISLPALIALSPFFFLVAVLIRMDSPGPIFYMQKRVGMDGRVFWMFKFRTMKADAEAESGPGWSKEEDPRVTRLGDMLRKSSLDEVPQLINVLKGEMSLVGPRPERPFYVEKFEKGIPRYMERHKVKSGMSGWAQVNGLRGDTSISERLQYDLYYIENWSIWFDFKIVILTIFDILATVKNVALKK